MVSPPRLNWSKIEGIPVWVTTCSDVGDEGIGGIGVAASGLAVDGITSGLDKASSGLGVGDSC